MSLSLLCDEDTDAFNVFLKHVVLADEGGKLGEGLVTLGRAVFVAEGAGRDT